MSEVTLNPLECALGEARALRRQVGALQAENARLRELAGLLLWGVDNDMPRAEGLLWSQRVNALAHELGIEVTK